MKLSLEQFKEVIPTILKTRNNDKPIPILISGIHGVGKSEILKQIAQEMELDFYDVRLCDLSEGDLLGMPKETERGTTTYSPPEFVLNACERPYMLLFDEFNRASDEVRRAMMRAGDSHAIGDIKLHSDTIIAAAMNPHSSGYDVYELDLAEKSRWWMCEFAPTVDEWLEWAREVKICKAIISFIEDFPSFLDPCAENQYEPTRRGWARLSASLDVIDSENLSMSFIKTLSSGYVGDRVASVFSENFIINDSASSYTQYIKKGKIFEKKIGVLEASSLVRFVEKKKVFMGEITDEEMSALVKFYSEINNELAFLMSMELMSGSTKKNLMRFVKSPLFSGGGEVRHRLAKLLYQGGDSE